MRRTMWNPTLRKKREEWGTHGVVSYRKSEKRWATRSIVIGGAYMGRFVLDEERIPCPCGAGHILFQTTEHDVYASGRSTHREMECENCSRNYRFTDVQFKATGLMKTEDYEKWDASWRRSVGHQVEVEKLAVDRYGDRWVAFLKARYGNRVLIHAALQGFLRVPISTGGFQRKTAGTQKEGFLKKVLADNIEKAFAILGVDDPEITVKLDAIEKEREEQKRT